MDELKKLLLKYKNKIFLLVEPGGNHGDSLIYMGMEKILKNYKIKYNIVKYKEIPRSHLFTTLYWGPWKRILNILILLGRSNKNVEKSVKKIDKKICEFNINTHNIRTAPLDIILVHGGGNINDHQGFGVRLLKNLMKNNPKNIIIVGPQTYWFQETCFAKLFNNTKAQIHLFSREKYSYKLLKSMNLPENVHVYISKDTAFYLSKKDFRLHQDYYDLICFRKDVESKVFQDKKDFILLQKIGTKDLRKSKEKIFIGDISLLPKFNNFLDLIKSSKTVYTDRLHVAILAAILRKKTFLYPNFYYKNRGVYEYSLSEYENVEMITSSNEIYKIKEKIANTIKYH